jgi:hypothetical protein
MVVRALEAALDGEPGWSRPEPHRFQHEVADVDIFVFARDAVVVFDSARPSRTRPETQAVGCRTTFHPAMAAATVLEVARALVAVRTVPALTAERDDGLTAGESGVKE